MDTIVHYHRGLQEIPLDHAAMDSIVIREGSRSDARAVAGIAKSAFFNYIGRYHSDPNIDRNLADEAYVEWAKRAAINCSRRAPLILAEVNLDVIAFLTLRASSSSTMEVELNAVKPTAQGQGVYRRLLLAALAKSSALGFSSVSIATQIQNYPVQRIWTCLGFEHFRSFYTFHKWL